jgi:hypothetical protein
LCASYATREGCPGGVAWCVPWRTAAKVPVVAPSRQNAAWIVGDHQISRPDARHFPALYDAPPPRALLG